MFGEDTGAVLVVRSKTVQMTGGSLDTQAPHNAADGPGAPDGSAPDGSNGLINQFPELLDDAGKALVRNDPVPGDPEFFQATLVWTQKQQPC